ncbi:anthrone oxygenase family protein [Streptomyces sp. NPDC051907]|uniref:anthrone oxygenase family protein n=1 Tax=Streptomyces sp. NPDC051907 TaxID=3155284 RepID=UPI003432A45B
MAATLLALAVVCNGLYAGFMLIFQTGIMPALARLSDEQFVPAMRRINETVPRPLFVLVFLGLVAFPAVSLAVPGDDRSDTQMWLIVAGLVCGVLNHLVTVGGNIPLNNALAASESASPRVADREVRAAFEGRWNRLHLVRTVLIVAAFALLVAASLS